MATCGSPGAVREIKVTQKHRDRDRDRDSECLQHSSSCCLAVPSIPRVFLLLSKIV